MISTALCTDPAQDQWQDSQESQVCWMRSARSSIDVNTLGRSRLNVRVRDCWRIYPTTTRTSEKSWQGGMTLNQPSFSRLEIKEREPKATSQLPAISLQKLIATSSTLFPFLYIILFYIDLLIVTNLPDLPYPIKPRFFYISSTRRNVHLVRATREASPPVRLSNSNYSAR